MTSTYFIGALSSRTQSTYSPGTFSFSLVIGSPIPTSISQGPPVIGSPTTVSQVFGSPIVGSTTPESHYLEDDTLIWEDCSGKRNPKCNNLRKSKEFVDPKRLV